MSKENLLTKIIKQRHWLNKEKLKLILDNLYSLDESFKELIKSLSTSADRNIDSFISEAYSIYDICKCLKSSHQQYKITYEEQNVNGNPDLKIYLIEKNINIIIQLKCFSYNEIDNKRIKSLEIIKNSLHQHFPNSKFEVQTSLKLSEKNAKSALSQYMERNDLNTMFSFCNDGEKIQIIPSTYSTESISISIITDEYEKQIKSSYFKAQKSLLLPDKNTINIILSHDCLGDIDLISVSNALYGTDAVLYSSTPGVRPKWMRDNNGIINDTQYQKDGKSFVNYYLLYVSKHDILGSFKKHMYIIEEPKNIIDISSLLNIATCSIYDTNTYIETRE